MKIKKFNFTIPIHSNIPKKKKWGEKTEMKYCKYHEKEEIIYITAEALAKIAYLANHYTTEIACELLGNIEKNIIEDIYIFPQRITVTSVTRIITEEMPKNTEKDLVGMLHFHPGHAVEDYTTKFSGIDEQGGNLNYKINIVAIRCNNILGFNLYAEVYIVPECQKIVATKAEIKILEKTPDNLDNIEREKLPILNYPFYKNDIDENWKIDF